MILPQIVQKIFFMQAQRELEDVEKLQISSFWSEVEISIRTLSLWVMIVFRLILALGRKILVYYGRDFLLFLLTLVLTFAT